MNKTKDQIISSFAAIGYNLSFGESQYFPGWVVARCTKNGGPQKLKPLFNFRYPTEAQALLSLEGRLNEMTKRALRRDELKNKKREARESLANPFSAGQILYDSWGYEQTNIDFYQVVEVKPRSVVLRRIEGEMCDGGKESGMSSNVRPVADRFMSEPVTKALQVSVPYSGAPYFYIPSRHGSISVYDYGERGVYSSWYA